ncbi:MAG: SsrA-binding protein [Bacteroidetes bacterium 4572_128]|nr:MAG: SsrA-binding protein [Bacteroidetes bacterium 4572_128]
MANKIFIKNKKAYHDYEILEKFNSGIELTGTEIKSIRMGKVSLVDSYCIFENNELWVKAMHIAEYSFGSYNNHETKRDRKLLLTRKELNKLNKKVKEKGFSIIPTLLFFNAKGFAKIKIGLAKGKNTYDKRNTLKHKEAKREMDKMMKNFK